MLTFALYPRVVIGSTAVKLLQGCGYSIYYGLCEDIKCSEAPINSMPCA